MFVFLALRFIRIRVERLSDLQQTLLCQWGQGQEGKQRGGGGGEGEVRGGGWRAGEGLFKLHEYKSFFFFLNHFCHFPLIDIMKRCTPIHLTLPIMSAITCVIIPKVVMMFIIRVPISRRKHNRSI